MPLRSGDVFAGYTVVRAAGRRRRTARSISPPIRGMLRQDALRVLPAAVSADDAVSRPLPAARRRGRDAVAPTHRRRARPRRAPGPLWLAMDFVDGTDAAALSRPLRHRPARRPGPRHRHLDRRRAGLRARPPLGARRRHGGQHPADRRPASAGPAHRLRHSPRARTTTSAPTSTASPRPPTTC